MCRVCSDYGENFPQLSVWRHRQFAAFRYAAHCRGQRRYSWQGQAALQNQYNVPVAAWGVRNMSLKHSACVLFLTMLAPACGGERPALDRAGADLATSASLLVVDTHIDVPYRLIDSYQDVSVATGSGDFDWPRARAGGLDVAFMSIYIPAEYQEAGGARQHAETLIAMVRRLAEDSPDKFAIVTSTGQARAAAAGGRLALALGMENGAGIEDDLANLAHFYAKGIRYITLTHSKANLICDSSYDENRPWGGLSPFGEQVVREMNRLGIMVDISHVSDAAFYDVLDVASAPLIASHSSARHFTPGFERNMNDEMIRALAARGGVIQINFGSAFLTAEANAWSETYYAERKALLEKTGWDKDGEEIDTWGKRYRTATPYPFADLTDVLDHIDHVVALTGVEHVGVGSDFDGVGDSLPTGLKDVSDYPNLVSGLRKRGYSDSEIQLVLGENLMRVWAEVEQQAVSATEGP